MMTPLTIRAVPGIMDTEEARNQLRDGISNAIASLEIPQLDALGEAWEQRFYFSSHPDAFAWERTVDAAVDEVLPDVAASIEAAIALRLPWEAPRG